MTRPDDVPADMTASRRDLDDAAAGRLLAGRPVDGVPELAALVQALRATSQQPVTPRGELAALLAEGFDPAHRPAGTGVPTWAPAKGGWRRHPAVGVVGLSLAAKVVLGSGVAVASVGTAAGLGVLPDPVQERVAGVVSTLTPFDLPRPDDRGDGPAADPPAPVPAGPRESPPPGASPTPTRPAPAVVPPVPRPDVPVPPAPERPVAPEPPERSGGSDRPPSAAPDPAPRGGAPAPDPAGGAPDRPPAPAQSRPAPEQSRPESAPTTGSGQTGASEQHTPGPTAAGPGGAADAAGQAELPAVAPQR